MGFKPRRPEPKLEVTLQFETKAHMDFIMGQLTDGFGENEAYFSPTKDPSIYTVGIMDNELWEHHRTLPERIEKRMADWKAKHPHE